MIHPDRFPRAGLDDDEDEEATQMVFLGALQPAPKAERDRLTLMVVEGTSPGRPIPLRGPMVRLGRGSRADLRLDDPSLSRVHAAVRFEAGRWSIEDVGSTNGTWIDDVRVSGRVPLEDHQRLRLGDHTEFRVVFQDAAEQRATVEVFRSSITDPLTRLHNRGHFDERLGGELAYAQRHGSALTLILLDVDHFKQVNDRYGHPAGDAVLRVLGASLARVTRLEDLTARYGGEEFAIVARGLSGAQGVLLAERLRNEVASLRIPTGEHELEITVSLGMATHQDPAAEVPVRYPSPAALLEAADAALYRAKQSGRNRTCTA